jgi:flagellar FliL protein
MTMAEEEKPEGAGEEGEGKKKGGLMKILVFVFGALLLIIVSVGATLYLTGFFDVKNEQASTEVIQDLEKTMVDADGKPIEDKGPEKTPKETPDSQKFEQSYQDFKAKFTVNVPNSKKYVQFSLSVMTYYDERVLGNVDKHETALRSAVIGLVALEPAETYQSQEGMDKLKERIKDALNRVLMKYEDFGGIEEVYFTEFVLQ